MSHVVVKWLNMGRARIFDVVAVRDIADAKVGAAILQNPKDANVVGAEVAVRWHGEKHPARIVAVGTNVQMEKRCKTEIKQAGTAGRSDESQCEKCDEATEEIASLKIQVMQVEEENRRLKATVDFMTAHRDGLEGLTSAVQDLRGLCTEMEERLNASTARSHTATGDSEEQVDIGGFLVRDALLKMLELSHAKSPTVYARELLRQLFEPGELAGTSITGKQSNAHKDKGAKPQLDPIRVNAVIKYTCKKFGLLKEGPVRASLSSMLNKEKATLDNGASDNGSSDNGASQ